MLQSLRARLFVSHLAVIAVVFILTAAVAFVPLQRAQAHLENKRLEAVMGQLAVQTGYMIRSPRYTEEDVGTVLNLQARSMGGRLVLFNRDGQVLHDSEASNPLNTSTINILKPHVKQLALDEVELLHAGRGGNDVPTQSLGVHNGQRIFLASIPLVANRVIAVVSPVRPYTLLRELLIPLSLASLIGLLGSVIATIFLSRSIARPISRLTRAANAVAAGNLDYRVPGQGNDEVGRLVQSFNSMVERLQATYDSQRRLLANIAHELRTPLTSIQGYALALRDDVLADEEERREALATISEESERVTQLVVQILQLARLESGQAEPHLSPVDLDLVIERIVRRHRVAAEQAQVTITTSIGQDHSILADEALIDQAIDNLVRNALQHTPPGGAIRITAMSVSAPRGDSRAGANMRMRIRVSDTGEGIPPEEIPRIFDRFHRSQPNGNVPTLRTGGFGLGLAIVREIVSSHRGTVTVESQPGRGATFVIDLPAQMKPVRPEPVKVS